MGDILVLPGNEDFDLYYYQASVIKDEVRELKASKLTYMKRLNDWFIDLLNHVDVLVVTRRFGSSVDVQNDYRDIIRDKKRLYDMLRLYMPLEWSVSLDEDALHDRGTCDESWADKVFYTGSSLLSQAVDGLAFAIDELGEQRESIQAAFEEATVNQEEDAFQAMMAAYRANNNKGATILDRFLPVFEHLPVAFSDLDWAAVLSDWLKQDVLDIRKFNVTHSMVAVKRPMGFRAMFAMVSK